jgi:hypothetical protein
MIAACSGGAGDIVYSMPTLRHHKVTRLYVKASPYEPQYGNLHSFVKPFIEYYGIECLPTNPNFPFFEYEKKIKYDIDLDQSRNEPNRGRNHIMRSFANHFGHKMPYLHAPWLQMEKGKSEIENRIVVALTPRWRENSRVDWKKVYDTFLEIPVFIGFKSDYENFNFKIGKCDFYPTKTLLDIAYAIQDCKILYTNQNVCLTLAQSFHKQYCLEVKPLRTNTVLRTQNEMIFDKKFFTCNTNLQ